MDAAELADATAEYDREWTGERLPGKPLTPAQRTLHRRAARAAKAKMGRPKVGAGAKIVPISIERGLLKRADAFAKRHRLKRSQMLAQGLQLLKNQ
jgi:hypothetical protein